LLALAHHDRFVRIGLRGFPQSLNQSAVQQRRIARQNQHDLVARHRQPRANSRVGARKVSLIIVDQPISIGAISIRITIARDDQIIGDRPHQPLYVGNQRLAAPWDQTFVLSTHALPLTSGQQHDRTRNQGIYYRHGGHDRSGKKKCCDITPACFPYNRT